MNIREATISRSSAKTRVGSAASPKLLVAQRAANRQFLLFETQVGWCAIAWSTEGVTNTQLPEKNKAALRERLQALGARESADVPRSVSKAVELLKKQLAGKPQNFDSIKLDLSRIPAFHQKIYRTLQKIPAGKVTTYGDLAALAGSPRAFRAVGQAMARNPLPIIIPCHRVVGAAGKLGGFSSFGGLDTKVKLLHLEGCVS
jgi:methylated-DNA-[protein]-cysteine S-methyltransferase